MKINKKIIVSISLAIILVIVAAIVFAIIQNSRQQATSPNQQIQSGLQDDKEAIASSLKFTTPREALAAVNGTLNITVEVNTNESIDRIEYSINGAMVASVKEAPYAVDVNVANLALGAYSLRGVMVNTAGVTIADATAEFTIVTPEKSVKPPANSGGGTSQSSTGGTTGGTTAGSTTPGGGTTSPITLLGWQLTSTNTGLTPHGLSCGSLPLYTGSSKPSSGTLISGKRIATTLDLSSGNITIEKSCIRPTSVGQGLSVITTSDLNNCDSSGCPVTPGTVTIRDSEIDGSLAQASDIANGCGVVGVANVQRTYVHHTGSGICMYNTGNSLSATVEGNYVHQLRAFGGSHNEAFTIRDFPTNSVPSRRMNIYNNRLDASSGSDTGAAFIQTYGGDINNIYFEGNLFEGQGYQLGLEAGFGHIYGTSMHSVNNRFSGTGYGVGYVTSNGLSYGWGEWRENFINNPSATDNKGAVAGEP